MFKSSITFFLLLCFVSINAQTWSDNEINSIKNFSLQELRAPSDPSNKYLNNALAILLGKALFNDKRLSSNSNVACSSCHIEKYSFTDNRKLAFGFREGFRNTSTLLNSGSQHWYFADGVKDSLWSQALSSIENPAEHNFTRIEVMHLIIENEDYRKQYQQLFESKLPEKAELVSSPKIAGPNAKLKDLIAWKKLSKEQRHSTNIIFTNIGKSIAAYVSTIQSSNSRFNDFVNEIVKTKQSKILNKSEQRGLRLFVSQKSGCANCHSGPLFTNKSFHNISTGIPGKDNGRSEVIEAVIRDEFNCLGKYSDAKPEECMELNYINRDKHQLTGTYKTSTLLNIGKTSPYMHDGRFDSLGEVIKHYISSSQKKPNNTDLSPISLNDEQQNDLVNFLLTL